ncbi:2-alkenal reductase (NADP(+)-dependent)-like [Tasmannia lanceolata]|uniref:2-alkenal reductase (NADP(+)-dependent)-like n=1 Tax=Tasmannia lanceolata TaxID=3420 RepID=UPI004064B751
MEVENKYVTLKKHIEGAPLESDLEMRSTVLVLTVGEGSDDVIVKNMYVSIDPYQINRMKKYSPSQTAVNFSTRLDVGQAIDAYGIGMVVASNNSAFQKDDMVAGLLGWAEYSIIKGGNMLWKIDSKEFPLSYHGGILGFSGLTAYAGFFNVCKPKKGEKVFVSAASGSVGNVVGQYAKLLGCYVIGCAGTKEKVDLLKDKLGFDDAFNYKEESDLKSTLKRYFPEGIDIYFDNVGAEMQEAAVANMNAFGRVAVCGVISEYLSTNEKRAAPDMLLVVYKRITIQGFLAGDYMDEFANFISTTSDHLRHNRIHVVEDISQGLESIPSAFAGLFRGDNVGKKLVQITQD